MVAIVTGNGLGLAGVSSSVLGSGGQLGVALTGRGGEAVTVNAKTGNLVVQHQDEFLAGRGLDIGVVRTYNSGATFDFDNGDGWQLSLYKKLGTLTGTTVNTAGSTIRRTGADGAQLTYTYDTASGKYLNKDGGGSYDTLAYNSGANTWTWTDGDSRVSETYAANPLVGGEWRITGQTDIDGNALTYAYDATSGLITQITDANGEVTQLTYNASKQLLSVQVITAGTITTRIRYTYDTSNRLSTVTTDLTPADGSIADGKTYTTTYTYDGTSTRIASIVNSDGTRVSVTYDTSFRVQTVVDGAGKTTTFTYNAGNTTVTDPLGQVSTLTYDANGNLTRLQGPSGSGQDVNYAYNTNGDLTQLTDSRGNAIAYTYDASGNLTRQQDAAGNVIERAYNSANQLIKETVYAVPDPDGAGAGTATVPQTTWYVRDANQHLRFTVSPEGRVTEYRYNVQGQQTSSLVYTAGTRISATLPLESDLVTWVDAQDKTRLQRTDTTYDARGLANQVTRFTKTDSTGAGIADGSQTVTQYVYDSAGRLLQQIDPRGTATTGIANDYLTAYAYDGLGRTLSITQYDAAGSAVGSGATRQTLTSFNDALNRIEVTLANGLKRLSTFDQRGLLISQVEQDGATVLATQTYRYDADGQLRIVTDANGNKTYTLYDTAGRMVGSIDAAGALTETLYNNAGQATKTIRYATAVSVNLATLFTVDANGIVANVALASVRPTATANDPISRAIYDGAGRLRFTIDARGYVTERRYDGAGRLLTSLAYANPLNNVTGLDGLGREAKPSDLLLLTVAPTGAQTGLLLDGANDRVSRNFYDNDGLLRGTLDGEGTLTEFRYDAAGRLNQTIRYGSLTTIADRAAGTLATLIVSANAVPANNITAYAYYDGLGQLVGELDGEGYYTATQYDLSGNRTRSTRYANRLTGTPVAGTAPQIVATVPGSVPTGGYVLTHAQDQAAQATWTAFGQRDTETAVDGTLTKYTYDALGNRLTVVVAQGAADSRTGQARYDKQGRLIQELSARGSQALAALGASPTQAQIDAVWASYGTTYTYDAAGRRVKSTDANGNVTLYFYDAANRLTYTVRRVKNPANTAQWVGEVSARQFNVLGQVAAEIRYANRIAATPFATLTGGSDAQVKAVGVIVADAANDSRTDLSYLLTGEVGSSTVKLNTTENALTTLIRNAFGEVSARQTSLDATRTRREELVYDRRGLLLTDKRDVVWASNATATGVVTSATYDAFGRLVSRTDGRGSLGTVAYDKLGRQLQTITASGSLNLIRSATFDAFGRMLTQTDALGKITTTAYAIDSVTGKTTLTVTTPEGIISKVVTDRYGQTLTLVDGLGNETRYGYDADGNLTSTKRWDKVANAETTLETDAYDAVGNRLTVTDANGNQVIYTFDAANRLLTRRVDPTGLNLTTTYAYDAKGQQVSVTDPVGTVTQTTYDLAGRLVQVAIDPTGLNLRTQYAYDLAGNQVTVVDGYGTADARTTQYTYDSLDRRTRTTVDPAGLNLATTYAYDQNDNLVTKVDAAGTALARTTRYSYDAANRLVYTVDALGGVVKNDYDAEGRLLQRTAYVTAIALGGLATAPSVTAVAALIVTNAIDRTTRHVYDQDGRERFTIDAKGGVSETQYDAAGNATKRIAYANPLALAGTLALGSAPPIVATVPGSGPYVLTSGSDQTTTYTYDAFNRLATTTDALGTVTKNVYDAAGNLIDSTAAFGTGLASTVHRTYDKAGRLSAETRAYGKAEASTTTYGYDALGHQTTIVEASGTAAARTTRQEFDKAGRKTAAIDGNNARTTTTYNARGDIVKVTDALNNAGYFYTDILGRVTLQVDPEGTVSETRYDALGNVTDTFKYANKVVGTVNEATRPQILAAAGSGTYVVQNGAADQHQQVLYDTLGRKSEIRTWWGPNAADYYSETFTYDARGNVLTAKAKNGATTTYAYDALDRKTLETLPVTTKTSGGASIAVQNKFEYDALGNRFRTTEALGAAEQRITNFAFDKLNRQVSETGPSITTYDPVSDTSPTLAPVKQRFYDALGNLVEERDAKGNRTIHYYDAQGRESGRIDGAGAYTTWTYDAAGNKVGETRYANAVATLGTAILSNASAPQLLAAAPLSGNAVYVVIDSANDRTVAFTYDSVGRPTGTRLDNMTIGAYNPNVGGGTYQVSTGSITTATGYDAMGNVVKTIDGNGNVTRSYYNKAGQQVGQLDAKGYLTVWTRDTAGNVTQATQYANAVAATLTVTDTTSLATLQANVAASADNRITVYTYDKLNRVLTQTRKSVAGGTVNTTNGVLSESTADATTTYVYDGLNNVTRQTDATGAVTDLTYDALGRKTKEQKPGYVDYLGATVRPTTDIEYDGLNNVKREIDRGTDNAVETDDRITVYTYDAGGFLASMTDANGAVTQYGIDANGNVTKKTLVGRKDADNVAVSDVTRFQYDGLNRQVKSTDTATGTVQEVRINSFGEITGKRTNGGGAQVAWPEFAQYDRAGRAWMSNSGDGITKVSLYDANGNATMTMTSTADLSGLSLAAVLARTDTLKNIAVYDARNQLSDTFEAPFEVTQQLATIAANTSNQSVFIANNSAIAIGPDATVQNVTKTGTDPVSAGSVSTTGALISGSVTGNSAAVNVSKGVVKYNQRVGATFTLPANLPGTGNIRAELSVSRPTYFQHQEPDGNDGYKYTYNYSSAKLSKSDTVTAINPPAYSTTPVIVAQGSTQISITAISGNDADTTGSQSYTLTLYQVTAYGNILIGTVSGTVNSSGTTYATNIPPPRRLTFNGQPINTDHVLLAVRAQGSNAPWNWIGIPAQTSTGGATIQGSFAWDWTPLAGGNYEYQYYAMDGTGAIVNQQTGNLNLTNTAAPSITQNTGALGGIGGAGRGIISVDGNLHLYELGDSAANVTVTYRIKGSGGAWTTLAPAPTKHPTYTGWFYLPYASTFASNTTYELDIVAKNASGVVINRARADFSRDASGNPTIGTFTAYDQLPALVHLTERTDTIYADISYRRSGSTGAFTTVRVTPTVAGSGRLDWDASGLVADPWLSYDYEVNIKAYSAGPIKNNETSATLRLGANPGVFMQTVVATNAAVSIALTASSSDTSPATTPPVASSTVSTTGALISGSVTGASTAVNVSKGVVKYSQRVGATINLPSNLPGTGNVRAYLSVTRLTYFEHAIPNSETGGTDYFYDYSSAKRTKNDTVTAITPSAYNASAVEVPQGSTQLSIGATSGTDAHVTSSQNYTLTLYQITAYGNILIGTVSGTVDSGGTTYTTNIVPARRLAFNGQPTGATSLLMAVRTQGSNAPWNWISIPAQTNTGGTPIQGSFAWDWTPLAGGNYEYQYYAISSTGAVVNHQSGNLNLANTAAPSITQDNLNGLGTVGMGGAGRGLPTADGYLHLFELSNSAANLAVKYRVKGGGGSWNTLIPAPTKHASLAGWFYVSSSTFATNTTYELDIVAADGSGNVVNRSRADFSRDASGNPAVSAFTAYTPQASLVTVTTLTNTAYVDIGYRIVGDLDPTYSTVRVNPTAAGSGVFRWDASGLVPNVLTDTDYELVVKSYDAGGAQLGSNNATLRLGPNATLLGIQTQNMPLTLRITPPQAGTTSIKLGFRLKGSNDIYTEVAGMASGGEFRLSLAGIPLPSSGSVDYEYVYDAFDVNGALLGRNTGTFTLNPSSTAAKRLDWVISNVGSSTVTIHKQQRTNAFGEVVQEIDGLGRTTDLSYNALGRLVKKEDPQTDVTLKNGFIQRARPTTRFVYDVSGRLIATIDPNGNSNTQVWMNGGSEDEIVLERHADTGLVTHKYDVFGDKRIDIDALGSQTDTAYDKLSHVTQVKHAVRAVGTPGNDGASAVQAIDSYTYDAAGNRISHTNALGATEKAYYDSLGRITQTKSFAGFATTYGYLYSTTFLGLAGKQVGGWQKTTTNAVGRSLIDKTDIFGRVTWHQDLGGHTFTYSYNAAGWLTSQTGSSGQNIATDYYANGNIKSIWDKALGTYTSYRYDGAGNRTFEGYVTLKNAADLAAGAKDYYQYANLEYDELNRLKRVLDPKADIKYEYDAAGNRRHVTSTYHDGVNGSVRTQDYWYLYDQMNRFTVTMGKLSTGARGTSAGDTSVTIVKGSTGVAIAYDLAGQRKQAQNGSDGTVEDYSYSADGYLVDVKINGVKKSHRALDAAGRVASYAEYGSDGVTVTYNQATTYDADSRLLTQSGTDGTTNHYYYANATDSASSQTGGGVLAKSVNVNGSTITTDFTYEYWDDAKETTVKETGYNAVLKQNNTKWKPGYSYHTYDVNGHLTKAIDAGSDGAVGNADDRTFRYVSDAQGLVMLRDEIAGTHVNRIERYYYANGVRVGDVGNDGPSRTDYTQAIARRKVDHKNYKSWSPVESADFDQNYEPVSPTYPGPTPTSYTVRAGDTLQSIARAMWGDGSLWYLIADANGLAGNEILKAGAVLTLPNKLTNIHNNAGTFRPYNPGEVIGDTSPTLPAAPPPPKPKKKGCGGAGIIIAVIAVVATIATAGAAAITMAGGSLSAAGVGGVMSAGVGVLGGTAVGAAAGLSAGGLFAAAAIGGAVGSIAGQLTGMAMGVQDKFSWGAVAAGALSAGAMAGIGNVAGAIGVTNPVGSAMINAAARSVVGQGINMLTGQQKSFSWASVAASAVSAPIVNAIGGAILGDQSPQTGNYSGGAASDWANANKVGASLVQAGIGALTSGVTRMAIVGGRLSWEAVAADALSSTVRGMYDSGGSSNSTQDGRSSDSGNGLTLRNGEGIQVDLQGGQYASTGYSTPDYSLNGGRLDASNVTADTGGTTSGDMSVEELAVRKREVEQLVARDVWGQEARDESIAGAQLFQTGGPARMPRGMGSGGFEMVRNGNWDNALNMAADPVGLLGELPGLKGDLAQLSQIEAKNRIDDMRQRMQDAGVKNVPDYTRYIAANGSGIDFQATAENLGKTYENHIRDQRMRETWGDDYQNLRIGKSGMTPMEFEQRVLDIHQQATDKAYERGVDLIARGKLAVEDGQYARTLGSFIDGRVRDQLRGFAQLEGINDSSASNIWAINRRIKSEDVAGYGIPDGRIGNNIYHDTTLARKDGYTPQISKWNAIREGNFLIVRPSQLGGSYAITRDAIQPYAPQPRLPGRRL